MNNADVIESIFLIAGVLLIWWSGFLVAFRQVSLPLIFLIIGAILVALPVNEESEQ